MYTYNRKVLLSRILNLNLSLNTLGTIILHLSKFTYVCPDCKSFYCEKCYNALVGLENACWACDNTLDESKPVKLVKKEDEIEAEIQEEGRKSVKK